MTGECGSVGRPARLRAEGEVFVDRIFEVFLQGPSAFAAEGHHVADAQTKTVEEIVFRTSCSSVSDGGDHACFSLFVSPKS
jgi:hypothetical protein